MRTDIVIPIHRRQDGLLQLLGDIRSQQRSRELKVILVNSAEGTSAQRVIEQVPDLDIIEVFTENNRGLKRDFGARQGDAPLILFIDDDVRVRQGFIEAHIMFHESSANKMAVACGEVKYPEDWVASSNYYRFRGIRHNNASRLEENIPVLAPNRIVTMNMSVRRSTYETVGPFSYEFNRYGGEDVEFGYRAATKGAAIYMIPGATAIHQEDRQDFAGYLQKVYVSTFYSTPLLVDKVPMARASASYRLTESNQSRAPKENAIAVALTVAAKWPVIKISELALRKLDNIRIPGIEYFFLTVSLLTIKRAVVDRSRGIDCSDKLTRRPLT